MRAADRLAEGEQPTIVEPPTTPGPVVIGSGGSTSAIPGRAIKPVNLSPDLIKSNASRREPNLEEIRDVVSDPKSTTQSVRGWLVSRGYRFERPPRGKDRPLRQYLRDLRVAATFAGQVRALVRHCDQGPRFTEVILSRFEQALMQQMFRLGDDGKPVELSTADLKEIAKLLEQAVDARKQWETLRREIEPTKPAGPQATFRDVSDRVRQILGIPIEDEAEDDDAGRLSDRGGDDTELAME